MSTTGTVSTPAPPPSPPASRLRPPSWLDLRLALGVLLVLGSILVGARIVSAADSSTRVWAVTHDLAAGTTLTADDVAPMRVRLFGNAGDYLRTDTSPAGRTLTRDLGDDELLPRAALTREAPGRILSLPVDALHAPESLRRGQQVDVFATAKSAPGTTGETVRVLSAVPVQAVRQPRGGISGGGSQLAVLVRVPPDRADELIGALRTAELDLTVVVGDPAPSS